MDLLQIALVFLIVLLSIFLAITGFQVFLILRDLKKALDKLNRIIETGEEIAQDIERPVHAASTLVSTISEGAKALIKGEKKESKRDLPKPRRFYKRTL
ncbi:hypothetical protein HYW42_01790 [Candidatus Daviesbacteria bacterium]|nr:hypothetical protein [Candidatus Daviesbacteria bacterium]